MREYSYSGLGLMGLLAAASSPYVLQSDPYSDLRDIRRIIGPKRKKAYRARYRRATKTTHRRDRVNVAARRRQCSASPSSTRFRMTDNIQNGEGVEVTAGDIALAQAITEIEFNNSHATYENAVASVIAGYRHSLAREPATADVERNPALACLASLRAAISLLEKGGKKAAASDKMFAQMLVDYKRAADNFAAALSRAAPSSEPAIAEGERDSDWFKRNANYRDPKAFIRTDPAYFASECAAAITAGTLAQSSTPPASKGVEVPDGWKLVPLKPTPLMVQAWSHASVPAFLIQQSPDEEGNRLAAECDWSAMLAASPTPSNDTLQGRGETWASIAEWCEQTFGPCTASRMAGRAAEEMKELRDETLIAVNWTDKARIEVADVLICLSRVPGIWEAVEEKMAINRARTWNIRGDGTGYHVKPAALQKETRHDG